MPIDTFLFDLDGTLVDSIPDLTKAINLLREELDLSAVTSDEVRGYVGDGVGLLLQRALPEELFNLHRRKRFMEIYTEHLTDETVIYPGILEFLDMHRDKPMAVVTNKPEQFAVVVARHLGLHRWTDVVIGGDTLPQKKPDPAPVFEALRRLGCDGDGGTMVGDGETDLRAGKAAGLRTIACLFGYRPEEALRREGADEFWTRFGSP